MDRMTTTHDGRLQQQDWQMLFLAVTARLRRCAQPVGNQTDPALAGEALRAEVLECVDALISLQAQGAQAQAQPNWPPQEPAGTSAPVAWLHRALAVARVAREGERHP